jgi:phosphonopyruvate decarboxylase
MIAPENLYNFLEQQGINFYTGVPDSLLKYFLKFIQDRSKEGDHIITANEGLAIALASGYHFRTGKLPVVYLQNSGLGNIINPLTSLADKEMYAVPMLLVIGWRGRPGTNDEPQHVKMGKVTVPLLETMEVPYYILDTDETLTFKKIAEALTLALKEQQPVALLVPEKIFEKYTGADDPGMYTLYREEVLKKIIEHLSGSETVICTTGKTGREFYEQNLIAEKKITKYFLSAGAMGHAGHIALGMKHRSNEKVILLDGDGALLMHMGSLPTNARLVKDNFIHVVINNGCHESVGGQPTEGFFADCCAIAEACGYRETTSITDDDELKHWLSNGLLASKVQFVEIRTNKISRADLGRPAGNPIDWKNDFMSALKRE